MAKRKGFTKAEHRELGYQLKRIDQQLFDTIEMLRGRYPAAVMRRVCRVLDATAKLRSDLDELACREHDGEEVVTFYFGEPVDDEGSSLLPATSDSAS